MTPHKSIWSLYDMLKFHADFFVRSTVSVSGLPRIVRQLEGWENVVNIELIAFRRECVRIGFRELSMQADRILDQTNSSPPPELYEDRRKRVEILLEELSRAILSKLQSCYFLRINTDKIEFYSDDDSPRFGEDVAKAFPKSTYHISEASRCFALERWDACVHHLMLATEQALQKWAKDLKLKPASGRLLIFSNWQEILDAARTHIKALRSNKTVQSDKKGQRISETVNHFETIKEAWRNHCQHGREKYDERRAKIIYNHVEVFMRALSSKKRD